MNEELYTSKTIRTFTGKTINIFEPDPEQICIEDIAHALSNLCRFNGHTKRFYSVAQHCVSCYNMVDVKYKKAALLHDAAEAYLTDLPRPIKNEMPEYRDLEDKLMKAIAQALHFEYPLDPAVVFVDDKQLETEWESIVLKDDPNFKTWNPELAEHYFLGSWKVIRLLKK